MAGLAQAAGDRSGRCSPNSGLEECASIRINLDGALTPDLAWAFITGGVFVEQAGPLGQTCPAPALPTSRRRFLEPESAAHRLGAGGDVNGTEPTPRPVALDGAKGSLAAHGRRT